MQFFASSKKTQTSPSKTHAETLLIVSRSSRQKIYTCPTPSLRPAHSERSTLDCRLEYQSSCRSERRARITCSRYAALLCVEDRSHADFALLLQDAQRGAQLLEVALRAFWCCTGGSGHSKMGPWSQASHIRGKVEVHRRSSNVANGERSCLGHTRILRICTFLRVPVRRLFQSCPSGEDMTFNKHRVGAQHHPCTSRKTGMKRHLRRITL